MMEASDRKLSETTSLCPRCKRGITAEIRQTGNEIVMRKECPDHGAYQTKIASDAAWYHEVMSYPAVLTPPPFLKKEVERGCPFDCGACPTHQQKVYLPVIPITSACNLDCPICYTINKNEDAFYMSMEEFGQILDVIRKNDPEMKIINLTGGEPTQHPHLTKIVRMCREAGIHRVTISTHGLPFIKNEEMVAELAELRARIVLSFDSFDDSVNYKMVGARIHHAKTRILEQLEKYDIDTTLIPVVAAGYNDHEIGKLVELTLGLNCIRSLEIHTMTYTGQGGSVFESVVRITPFDVLREIERSTSGKIRVGDFVPSPCAHPLCYQTCYLLQTGDRKFEPFARFMSKEQIRQLLTDNLYIEPGETMESVLQDVIHELWSQDMPGDTAEEVLQALKGLIRKLFPSRPITYAEQQVLAERSAKTIYIHSHMDEETFDTERIRQCCVGVPFPDGSNIPTCSYNVLYRIQDPRFFSLAGSGKKRRDNLVQR